MEDVQSLQGDATVTLPHLGPELAKDGEERIKLGWSLIGDGEEGLQMLRFNLTGVWSCGFHNLSFQFGGKCSLELPEKGASSGAEMEGKGEGGGGRGGGGGGGGGEGRRRVSGAGGSFGGREKRRGEGSGSAMPFAR